VVEKKKLREGRSGSPPPPALLSPPGPRLPDHPPPHCRPRRRGRPVLKREKRGGVRKVAIRFVHWFCFFMRRTLAHTWSCSRRSTSPGSRTGRPLSVRGRGGRTMGGRDEDAMLSLEWNPVCHHFHFPPHFPTTPPPHTRPSQLTRTYKFSAHTSSLSPSCCRRRAPASVRAPKPGRPLSRALAFFSRVERGGQPEPGGPGLALLEFSPPLLGGQGGEGDGDGGRGGGGLGGGDAVVEGRG